MQHPHEVDIVKAVLGSQKIVVYGEDLLRHSVADGGGRAGDGGQNSHWTPRVCGGPQGLLCRVRDRDLGQGPRCRTADSSPGAGYGGGLAPSPGVSTALGIWRWMAQARPCP